MPKVVAARYMQRLPAPTNLKSLYIATYTLACKIPAQPPTFSSQFLNSEPTQQVSPNPPPVKSLETSAQTNLNIS